MRTYLFHTISRFQLKDRIYPNLVVDKEARARLSKSIRALITDATLTYKANSVEIDVEIAALDNPRPACYDDAKNAADIFPAMVQGQVKITSKYEDLDLVMTVDIVLRQNDTRDKGQNVNLDFDWGLCLDKGIVFEPPTTTAADIYMCSDRDIFSELWYHMNKDKLNQHLLLMQDTARHVFKTIGDSQSDITNKHIWEEMHAMSADFQKSEQPQPTAKDYYYAQERKCHKGAQ
jgi:hypothetical protein